MNKDYIRELLTEEKKLMPLTQIKAVNTPNYDEISVQHLWPKWKEDADFMVYFPSRLPKNRLPEREYFFTVLNSLHEEYVQKMIRHAHDQRNAVGGLDLQQESINISENMYNQLNAFPFISCK